MNAIIVARPLTFIASFVTPTFPDNYGISQTIDPNREARFAWTDPEKINDPFSRLNGNWSELSTKSIVLI
jgi:hypothetical protein